MEHEFTYRRRRERYRLRLLACIAVSELLMLLLFNSFPAVDQSDRSLSEDSPQNIDFQQVEITRHTDEPAAPPKPAVSPKEPQEEVVEDEIVIEPSLGLDSLSVDFVNMQGNKNGPQGVSAKPVKNPDRPAQLYKIVEPEMPQPAKEAGIQAIIEVRFLIDSQGRVEEATISTIKVSRENGGYVNVDHINYGLPQATLNAALQWKFQPAVKDGKKVASYSIHPFSYGL